MADVRGGSRSAAGRDRGQLILVTGLLVAVTMVSLVLLLNTAIFTENLASRGTDQSGREAIEYRGTLVDEVGALVEAENAREPGAWLTVRDTTREGVLRIDNYTARNHATRGVVVAVNGSSLVLHEGRLIRQTNASRNFSDASGVSDWTLSSGVEDARNVQMVVDASSLVTANASDADSKGAFTVRAGGTAWQAFIYRNWSTTHVAVAVDTGSGARQVCSRNSLGASINLTAGTMNGSACSGLVFAEGVSPPYSVEYRDGANVTGTYELVVNSTNMGSLNDGTVDKTSPYFVPAVYSVTFDVYYESPTLTYRAPVRVAPGEPQ